MLSATPQENGLQHLFDGLHLRNTSALQQTGVPKWNVSSLCKYLFICSFIHFTLHVCVTCLEDACIELKKAIEAGDMQSASVFAASLARRQAALKIQPSTKTYEETEIK